MFACFVRILNRHGQLRDQLCSTERVDRLHALKGLVQGPRRVAAAVEPLLIGLLRSGEREEREAACQVIKAHYQVERLRRRLGHPHADQQVVSAWLLSAFAEETVLPVLFYKAQTAEHETVCQACIEVLVHLDSELVVIAAVEELSRESTAARRCGAQVLGAIGQRAHELLLRALADPRRQVRLGAVRALEVTGNGEYVQTLAQLLSDPVEEVRAEAARVLSEHGSEQAVERLVAALDDPAVMVRLEAAAALTRVPGDQAAEALASFLRQLAADPNLEVADREFLHAIAADEHLDYQLFHELLASASEPFAVSLALALEEAGTVARWLESLPTLSEEGRAAVVELLRRLVGLGVREPLMNGLGLAAPELRAMSAWLLGECKHAAAVGPLVGLLCDREQVVRHKAAQALGQIGDALAIPGLVEALGDPDQEVRSSAVAALAGMLRGTGEQPPVEAQEGGLVLVEEQLGPNLVPPAGSLPVLRPSPYTLPSRFSEALGRLAAMTVRTHLGADSVLTSATALVRCLHDPSPGVREKAAEAVADLGLTSAISALLERALHDGEAAVRGAAARALARLPDSDYAEALTRALGHGDAVVRARAAEALGESGATHAAPELVSMLGDSDSVVRQKAARALWQVASHGMAEQLLEHLHNPDPQIRCAIAGVLGRIRAVGAAEALANRLEDPNQYVRASAANALAQLGADAQGCLPRVLQAARDPDEYVRARAVEALGEMGSGEPDQVLGLLEATRDANPEVASGAMKCLVRLANQGVLRPLVDALASPGREGPVRAVLENVDLGAMRTLLRMAREVNEATSRVLLSVIAEVLRKRGSLEACRADLLSLDPTIRLAGLESLGLLRRPEATEAIIQVMCNDPLPALRERAASILGELDDPVGLAALARARSQSLLITGRSAEKG